MEVFLYFAIFGFLFTQTEMKPTDDGVILKLPSAVKDGTVISLRGIIDSEADILSFTFMGNQLSAENECRITYVPMKKIFYITNRGGKHNESIHSNYHYPTTFEIEMYAKSIEEATLIHVIEFNYYLSDIDPQPLYHECELSSFNEIDSIAVKGFPNIQNLIFTFN